MSHLSFLSLILLCAFTAHAAFTSSVCLSSMFVKFPPVGEPRCAVLTEEDIANRKKHTLLHFVIGSCIALPLLFVAVTVTQVTQYVLCYTAAGWLIGVGVSHYFTRKRL